MGISYENNDNMICYLVRTSPKVSAGIINAPAC